MQNFILAALLSMISVCVTGQIIGKNSGAFITSMEADRLQKEFSNHYVSQQNSIFAYDFASIRSQIKMRDFWGIQVHFYADDFGEIGTFIKLYSEQGSFSEEQPTLFPLGADPLSKIACEESCDNFRNLYPEQPRYVSFGMNNILRLLEHQESNLVITLGVGEADKLALILQEVDVNGQTLAKYLDRGVICPPLCHKDGRNVILTAED